MIILTTRSPEVDPEVILEADHLMGLAVLLPKVTEFILVIELISMTEARIETTDQIMVHATVITATGTIPIMTDTVMTGIMTSTVADIMTGVMTGGMMTEVDTCLHIGVLLPEVIEFHGVTPASETGEIVVSHLTINMMGTTVTIIVAGPHLQTAGTITIVTSVASLLPNQSTVKVILQNAKSKRLRSTMLCIH